MINDSLIKELTTKVNDNTINIDKIIGLIPKYYYTNNEDKLTFTTEYDCYCEVEATVSTWGFGGNSVTVSISCSNATTIYNYQGVGNGADVTARDVSAKALFKMEKGKSYTVTTSRNNQGGMQCKRLLCKLIPNIKDSQISH